MTRWALHDEWDDSNADLTTRQVAGPFDGRQDAIDALNDPAYLFTFPTGPATICGDLTLTRTS